ncbi:hypothetical protein RRG08_037464 [Elysia crispata]|uniref:Uncharacterized protein n=1 Tax=Elysia crispata TaxID=231223 RepID=A0AAE1AZD2_9GAST|nr:hypothetical protein RRG08_037464 [Elysia crispata]
MHECKSSPTADASLMTTVYRPLSWATAAADNNCWLLWAESFLDGVIGEGSPIVNNVTLSVRATLSIENQAIMIWLEVGRSNEHVMGKDGESSRIESS